VAGAHAWTARPEERIAGMLTRRARAAARTLGKLARGSRALLPSVRSRVRSVRTLVPPVRSRVRSVRTCVFPVRACVKGVRRLARSVRSRSRSVRSRVRSVRTLIGRVRTQGSDASGRGPEALVAARTGDLERGSRGGSKRNRIRGIRETGTAAGEAISGSAPDSPEAASGRVRCASGRVRSLNVTRPERCGSRDQSSAAKRSRISASSLLG
jgi:hypothetical protein